MYTKDFDIGDSTADQEEVCGAHVGKCGKEALAQEGHRDCFLCLMG